MVFAYDDVVWRLQGRQLRREDRYKVQDSKNKLTSKSTNYNPQGWTHFSSHCLQPGWNGYPSGDAGVLHHGANHILRTGVRAAKKGQRAKWSSCSSSAIPCQLGEPVNKQYVWKKVPAPIVLVFKKKKGCCFTFILQISCQIISCGHFSWKHSERENLGNSLS